RGSSGIPHNVYDTIPAELTRNSICGIHWPNILREDPSGNGEAVARWIEYMRAVGGQPDVMLASSMTECVAQWVYHTFVDLRVEGNEIVLDGTRIPDEALRYASSAPMWLKVQGTEPIRPEPVPDGPRLVGYDEGGDAVLLGLAGVRREVMRVRLHPGEAPRDPYVLRTGTSGTCDCSTEGHSTSVTVEACGRQVLQVRTGRPAVAVKVECDTPASAELLDFNVETGVQTVSVNAHDIQGAAVGLELIH
ncbi:MAG TPA: hypothetical protein QGH10_27550, partial [Armatimonadota bacterium]|nr:hypothetical protein [Armatimonadota bacterium]